MKEQVNGASSIKQVRVIVKAQFDKVFPFSEGRALVRVGDFKSGKFGYVDKTGKIVVKPQFESAYHFSDGLANVAVGTR